MAIDTAAKRNSALLDPGNLPWPPDGTIATADRLVMLEFYSGIAAAAPSVLVPCDTWQYVLNDTNLQYTLDDRNWQYVLPDSNIGAAQ